MVHPNAESAKTPKSKFVDALIDSAIVGGIAGTSTYVAGGPDATIGAAFLAFVMAFLVKLRALRGIKSQE